MRSLSRRAGIALLALLWAGPARAEGLYLTWGDCAAQGAGSPLASFGCTTDVGSETLYCGLIAPQPVDSVLAMEIVIDLQAQDPLPDWWRYDFTGCHATAIHSDVNFTGKTACKTFWPISAAGGLLSYTPGMPRGGNNQARIRLAFSVPSNQPLTLNATDMFYVARLVLDHTGATAGCPGCDVSACMVLNSILIQRPPRPAGVPTTDILVTTPGAGSGNWASWQSSSAGACQAVPVRKVTWGQIKSLYR